MTTVGMTDVVSCCGVQRGLQYTSEDVVEASACECSELLKQLKDRQAEKLDRGCCTHLALGVIFWSSFRDYSDRDG